MMRAPKSKAAPATLTVMHVFPSFGYGGQQARFAALAGGLGEGFRHVVVSLDDDMAAQALIGDDLAVNAHKLVAKKSSFASLTNIARLQKAMKQTRLDLLCTYNWGSIEAAIANALGPHAPHLHFEDGFSGDETAGRQKTRRVMARRFLLGKSTVVVPSRTLENIALKHWKLSPARVRRIPNGVDYERFQKPSTKLRSTVAVGTVGALRREKNYRRLIEAFAAADRDAKATLTIIGAGPERETLLALAAESPAASRIELPGPAAAPEDIYCDLDIFALSSDTEQAPLTVMEAMAAGLPVVAPDVGDIVLMVSAENRAFITKPGDDEAFRLALLHLIQNPDARAHLGAANRKKAREEFDLSTMIARHRDLYLETAGRND